MTKKTIVVLAAAALLLGGCGKKKADEKAADTSAEPRPRSERASEKRDRPSEEPKAEADKPASGGSDVESIPECAAHFKRVLACAQKGPVTREKEVEIKKRGWQDKLDKGTKPAIIKGACEIADKVFKCG